jgi:plasmid maintenance system antidote protein VapI
VTRQQLYKVIKGESAVTPEMAVCLEKAFGGSADAWLRMQMNFDLARARECDINMARWSLRLHDVNRSLQQTLTHRVQSTHPSSITSKCGLPLIVAERLIEPIC